MSATVRPGAVGYPHINLGSMLDGDASWPGGWDGRLGECFRPVSTILLAAAAGVVGYWAVAAAAAVRVARHGLGDDRRVLWWIAAGCGGLAAVSVGRALAADDSYWPPGVSDAWHIAAAATWALAAALAVPIVIESLRWLSGTRRIVRLAPWPPTFSTAVFALGGLATGAMFHAHAITMIGKVAGFATLALWAITAGLHVTRAIPTRRGRRRGVGGLQRTAGAPPRRPAAGAAQETWDREDAHAGATIALIVEPRIRSHASGLSTID